MHKKNKEEFTVVEEVVEESIVEEEHEKVASMCEVCHGTGLDKERVNLCSNCEGSPFK